MPQIRPQPILLKIGGKENIKSKSNAKIECMYSTGDLSPLGNMEALTRSMKLGWAQPWLTGHTPSFFVDSGYRPNS